MHEKLFLGLTPFLDVVAIMRRIYHHIANSGLIIFQSSTGSGFCLILVGVLGQEMDCSLYNP
jgi:hypothetical protein